MPQKHKYREKTFVIYRFFFSVQLLFSCVDIPYKGIAFWKSQHRYLGVTEAAIGGFL